MKYLFLLLSFIFILTNLERSSFCLSKSPFHLAVETNDLKKVKLLIKQGANINQRDKNGLTPLHFAAAKGIVEVAKVLITNGANINIKDEDGSTPLFYTAINDYYGNKEVADLLLDNGAELDAKGKYNNTPLHFSIKNCNLPIFTLLIKHGADINVENDKGYKPIDLANKFKDQQKCIEVSKRFKKKYAFIEILEAENIERKTNYLPLVAFTIILLFLITYLKRRNKY